MGPSRYVDHATLVVRACEEGSYPDPTRVERGWGVRTEVGSALDVEQLVDEIEEILRGHPFELREQYGHFSWGAEGAFVEIVVGITSGTAVVVIERLLNAVTRRGRGLGAPDLGADGAIAAARDFVSRALDLRSEEFDVARYMRIPEGHQVELTERGSGSRFTVKVDAAGCVIRFERV